MASSSETPAVDQQPTILFRANRKRKVGLRQRAPSPDDATLSDTKPTATDSKSMKTTEYQSIPSHADSEREADDKEEVIPSAIRHRARKRLNGVGFSASRATAPDETTSSDISASRALVPATSPPVEDEPLITKRFAPQTGLATTIVNKHIPETDKARTEYIESRLSNRKSPVVETRTQMQAATSSSTAPTTLAENDTKAHPIMQGKLMEVDLGDEVRARNQAMTEKAARRLLGEAVPEEETEGTRKAKKPRLGRDGKPWRPRNRRGSDDIKRDELVEKILRENKLDVYDVPAMQQPQYEGDGDADDRIAEEFRREFMDAMVQRQQKKKAAVPPARAGARKTDEEVLKGPKLGGSRNSRAAMRDLLLKKEREAKK
nr:mRNA splicing factor rna helicase [Colletotrichum truncatum]KAF6792539.1 mRNA splicing factor rna helicase [Colletotrichum truncatum]